MKTFYIRKRKVLLVTACVLIIMYLSMAFLTLCMNPFAWPVDVRTFYLLLSVLISWQICEANKDN